MNTNEKYYSIFYDTEAETNAWIDDPQEKAIDAVVEAVRADTQGEHHTHITINCTCTHRCDCVERAKDAVKYLHEFSRGADYARKR